MNKDLDNVIQSVQEFFDDDMTKQCMGLSYVTPQTEGVLIADIDGNQFLITVKQLEVPK